MNKILDSAAIGETWNHVRDKLPSHAREVRLAVKVRTDHDGAIERPSRVLPPPRVIVRNVEERAHRAKLVAMRNRASDAIEKIGTGPKFLPRAGAAKRPLAGLLTYQPEPEVHVTTREERIAARIGRKGASERFEPLSGSQVVWNIHATLYGPLSRREQAIAAFVCADYGTIYS